MKILVHCRFPLVAAAFESLLCAELDDARVLVQADPELVRRTCSDQRPELAVVVSSGTPTTELSSVVATLRRDRDAPALMIITSGFDDAVPTFVGERAVATLFFDDSVADIRYAIKKVLSGESVITSRIAAPMMASATAAVSDSMPVIRKLAPREREVLRLLGEGMTNLEIARALHLGHNTVKSYVSHVLNKLGVRNRVEGALLAKQLELLLAPVEDR